MFFNSPEERREGLRVLILERGAVRIAEVAIDFGVSEMTVRRDFDELESLGLAPRVRGGAIALGPEPWEERHRHNARAKAQIAEKLLPTRWLRLPASNRPSQEEPKSRAPEAS